MKKLVFLSLFFWSIMALVQAQVPQGLKEKEDKDKFQLQEISLKSPFTLDDEFYFNKKFYFTAKTSEVQVNSYFYMNTKTGQSAFDKDVADQLRSQLGSEVFTDLDFAIRQETGEFFTYATSRIFDAKVSSINREVLSYLPDYLEEATESQFLKDYMERDGNKTYIGDKSQFPSESFQGVNLSGGGHMLAWLSRNTDLDINPGNRPMMLSPFGLGYVFFENRTYLVAGWESDDYVARLEKIEDVNLTFDGKDYMPFQQKVDEKISDTEEKMAASRDKEAEALARREAETTRRAATADSSPTAQRRAQIDQEITEIKKQILEKRKVLEEKAISKSKDISKKQGSLESAQKGLEEMFEGNEFVEIQKLELKESILKNEKSLLSNSLNSKDRELKQKEMDCQKRLLMIFEGIYDKFTQIDRQYADNPQQVFLNKMNLYTQEISPIMTNPCGN